MSRARLAALVAAALVAAPHARGATAPATPELQPPRFTREQMEAAAAGTRGRMIVYGTQDPALRPALEDLARSLARRFPRPDSGGVISDVAARASDLTGGVTILLGGPGANRWTATLAASLPVGFTANGFVWAGTEYADPACAIHLVYPNPLDSRRFLLLVAGNSAAALSRGARGFVFGGDDWRITRDGDLARSGSFAQSADHPWRYDPARDSDREAQRRRFDRGLARSAARGLVVRAPAGLAVAARALADGEALLARMDRAGFDARGPSARVPVTLTLYRSLAEKGALTGNTRAEHLGEEDAEAALPLGRESLDLWSLAARRLAEAARSRASPYLEPAGVWFAERFEGEALATAVARLYDGGVLPSAAAAATASPEWRSPLVLTPARALLTGALVRAAGPRARPVLLAVLVSRPAGTLDSLCRGAGLPRARVEAVYHALADSLAHAGRHDARLRAPEPWSPARGFMRGACLAHSVSLEHGYLSADADRALAALRADGVDHVSLTPFGYVPSLATPEILPSVGGGPEEESDEAVCEAAAMARAHGLRVWIKPHLWTRGWTGDFDFGPSGWETFFDRYREFLIHYALLAERERAECLVVGHELTSATLGHPDRWREMIAATRRIYRGTLTYSAHWGEEAGRLPFWDSLDLIGVSFYAPLAERPTTSAKELRAGAARALAALGDLAARVHRPVVLDEIGYPSQAGAPVRPWEERSVAADPEAQRACYAAACDALGHVDWVAGVFWWKWFTAPEPAGPGDNSFSPRGKPAEDVLRAANREWVRRAVRVP